MTIFEATLLALVQGVTEFLPISSSAHLILLPYLLGWDDHSLTFDIVTNAGTLLAALVYFRHDLLAMWRQQAAEPQGPISDRRPHPYRTLPWKVGLATLPIIVAGLLFYDWISTTARHPLIIATSTLIFGLALGWADWKGTRLRTLETLRWRDALLIGLSQALALIPGTSRSGITMTTALGLGWTRKDAARFSFLLAIPVGLLAFAHDLLDIVQEGWKSVEIAPLVVGFLVAAISAYAVIGWLLAWLERQTMWVFVLYRLGLATLIYAVFFDL